MSSGYEVVDKGHVGGQEQISSDWKTIQVVFHDFAELPSKRGDRTLSPVLKCHGLEWQIQLYPGGHSKSSEADAYISLRLRSKSCSKTNKMKIRAKSRTRIPSAGKETGGRTFRIYSASADGGSRSWGKNDYAKREDVLKASKHYLVGGNLTVEVDIQVMLDEPPTWTPTNTVCSDMLKMLDSADAETADVSFEIGDGDKTATRSRKDDFQFFYAHKNILSTRAPVLAVLAGDCSPGTAIPISDVHPDLFRMLLRLSTAVKFPERMCSKKKLAASSKLPIGLVALDSN
mmetsp:Transcript_29706/g.69703  ORF Transcript_29706/g.69703 Transcript_29706/m.69703 type:complete len:288 (-) Transcript_29706:515-1378(-)